MDKLYYFLEGIYNKKYHRELSLKVNMRMKMMFKQYLTVVKFSLMLYSLINLKVEHDKMSMKIMFSFMVELMIQLQLT